MYPTRLRGLLVGGVFCLSVAGIVFSLRPLPVLATPAASPEPARWAPQQPVGTQNHGQAENPKPGAGQSPNAGVKTRPSPSGTPQGGRRGRIVPWQWFRRNQPYQSGLATWYGPGLQGKKTASGEHFDKHDFTAAHPTLPLGTQVRVYDVNTRKSVLVTINDRGPKSDAIIDLSQAAAREIGELKDGTFPVRLYIVKIGRQEENAAEKGPAGKSAKR